MRVVSAMSAMVGTLAVLPMGEAQPKRASKAEQMPGIKRKPKAEQMPAAKLRQTPEQAAEAWIEALRGGSPLAPREPAALRLAEWIDWTDAIALASALDGRIEGAGRAIGNAGDPSVSAEQLLAQGRARVLGLMRSGLLEALQEAKQTEDPAQAATTLRQAIAQAQRQMDAAVAGLRAKLRARLQGGKPAQQELAALDAVLERALAERQRHLLAAAAGRLARLGENADPSTLEPRLMAALTAELELRLQPLQGLVQALHDTESTHA